MYGLPENVKFCKLCVISNQRPSSTIEFKHSVNDKKKTIGFSIDSVCDACRYNETKEKEIDWKNREKQLIKLLKKYKRND